MDPHEPVSTHGDETGDWLWDFEDRYNVASAEDLDATRGVAPPTATTVAADSRVADVRRHVRSRNGRDGNGSGAAGGERRDDTIPVPTAASAEPRHIPPPLPARRPTHKGLLIAAAVLVVVGLGGLAYAVTRGSKNRSPGAALSTPTTPPTVVSGPFGVSTTLPPTSDTVTSTPSAAFPTTVTDPVTGALVTTGNVAPTGNGTTIGNGTGTGTTPGTTRTTTPSNPGTTATTVPTTVPAATTVPTTPAVTTVPTTPPTAPPTTVPTVTTTPPTGTTVNPPPCC